MDLLPDSPNHPDRFAFGLTEAEVRRLQDILRRCCHAEPSLDETWARAIELLALGKLLLDMEN